MEDSAEQGWVVWDPEQVALGEADVVLTPSAHQRAQVGFVHLVADGDDKELHPRVRHLADALLQDGLGDGLRPPVGEEEQLLPASGGVAAAPQVAEGQLHGLQHVGAVVLEGRLLRMVGQQAQVAGGSDLHPGRPAVLSQTHPDGGARLPVSSQETLGQAAHKLLAHVEVLLADAGRAVHHQQDIGAAGERDCNTHGKKTANGPECVCEGSGHEEFGWSAFLSLRIIIRVMKNTYWDICSRGISYLDRSTAGRRLEDAPERVCVCV